MTAVLERERTAAVEEREAVVTPQHTGVPSSKPSRFRAWMIALVVAVVAAATGLVITSQENAPETLTFRVIGETEALQRFAPGVETGLSFRVIGETEALQRFVPGVETGLSFRVIGETEALQRFVPGVAAGVSGLSFRVIGETEALQRFAPGVETGLSFRVIGETEALGRFVSA